MIADYKVAAAKHENIIDQLRKETQAANNELRQIHLDYKDGLMGEHGHGAKEHAE